MKKLLILMMLSVLCLTLPINALNDTEISQLRDAVRNDTQSYAANQTALILAKLNSVNATLTDSQVTILTNSFTSLINLQVARTCNPYLNNDTTLADPLQKALGGAISNSMDAKFIDQRQWIENTYIKKNDEYVQLKDQRDLCISEKTILNNAYQTANITSQVNTQLLEAKVSAAEEQKETWIMLCVALGALLLIFFAGQGFIKKLVRKE